MLVTQADVCRTGATGYIGGDAFHTLSEAHPEYEYSLLIRSKAHGETVKQRYPNIRIVLGQLDDYEIIKHEASQADIVLRGYQHDSRRIGRV